jgi:hypothetical protein
MEHFKKLHRNLEFHQNKCHQSKLSNHFSYVICAFTYHMVQSDIVLLYIWSRVWGIIHAVGPGVATVQTPPPRRPFPCDVRQRKVLDRGIVYACDAPDHTDCLWYSR